jgi:hypothetical protein
MRGLWGPPDLSSQLDFNLKIVNPKIVNPKIINGKIVNSWMEVGKK